MRRSFSFLVFTICLVAWQPVAASGPWGPPVMPHSPTPPWLPPAPGWVPPPVGHFPSSTRPIVGGEEAVALRYQVQALNLALRYRDNALAEARQALHGLMQERVQWWFQFQGLRSWVEHREAQAQGRIVALEAALADAAKVSRQRGQEIAALRLALENLAERQVAPDVSGERVTYPGHKTDKAIGELPGTREKLARVPMGQEGLRGDQRGMIDGPLESGGALALLRPAGASERQGFQARNGGLRNMPAVDGDSQGRLQERKHSLRPTYASAEQTATVPNIHLAKVDSVLMRSSVLQAERQVSEERRRAFADYRRRDLEQIVALRSENRRLTGMLLAEKDRAARSRRIGAESQAEIALLRASVADLETKLSKATRGSSSRVGAEAHESPPAAAVVEVGNTDEAVSADDSGQDTRDAEGAVALTATSHSLFKNRSTGAQAVEARGVYRVMPQDSLSRIAYKLYGDGKRWPEIYVANDHVVPNPDRLLPGLVLVIP